MNNITDTASRYVSEKTISEVTGIPRSMLQKQRHFRRGIPYIKIGKSVRYKLQDALDYMEARRINPAERV
jgi:hypothetical protein